ncbi:Flagellar biosynthesis protein FlhA [Anaerohalosphaera lusitana]|uniref:Flagellar biosynthesis protein FlhA n=1 Tax=Anaerohalosphaera lusitana TaxID=1936003 RepID=A0A1U9NG79_9BACT|nr:flagellar biosynthesis protein FlhA [Anaerohalosphaera lusitana]AQT66933.1 Flagellar biosynthesis protein FlhA [Anaerohalosphaera lusitana]
MSGQKALGNGPIVSSLANHSNVVFAVGLATILAMLIVPLPPVLLDVLLACSIGLAVGVLIVTLSAKKALELSTFPSLLLFVTLYRLSLNVSSTRLILLKADAGNIIDTFGQLVIGGNLVVGLVMFLILVVIQFVVITKGAERISEVNARFALDAMPGKQMAIDADLNAGAITDAQAKERRDAIAKESEFYGAMDGASKFIRGDAIAGLIITCVNLVGGIIIGSMNDMSVSEAAARYCTLSIGDGLVSQIPSVIIAISSGFLVTKTSSTESVSHDLTNQMLRNPQSLMIAGILIGAIGLVPGLPKVPFFGLAVACIFVSQSLKKAARKDEENESTAEKSEKAQESEKTPVEDLLNIDMISVQVGVRLIPMVDPRKKSSVFDRIGALRRKFAKELGLIIPLVRLCDNINIEPNAYEIRLFDHTIASGRLEPDKYLAMDPGTVHTPIQGQQTTEPVYGLPAMWISEEQKEQAELCGYTVIDCESVLITHLSETLAQHAHEQLTREDVQQLVDRLRKSQPSLVGDVVGEQVSVGLLQRVLQKLLKDRIPIKNLAIILEALGEHISKTKSATVLTELVRKALRRTITSRYKDQMTGKIMAITFDPHLEHQMVSSLQTQGEELVLSISPELAMQIHEGVAAAWKSAMNKACENVVLLCDSRQRSALAEMLERSLPRLPVLSYDEIEPGTDMETVENVALQTSDAMALNGQQSNV